jgi:hypothetical protein
VNKLGQRVEVKLEHDPRSVCLDSPDRDSQQRSDLLIRLPLSQEADNLDEWFACPCAPLAGAGFSC